MSQNNQPPKPPTPGVSQPAVSSELQAALAQAVKEGIAMGIMAGQTPTGPAAAPALVRSKVHCPECRQPNMACEGKHREAVVYPSDADYGHWFQGVILNGVRYLSNGPGHAIIIPEALNAEYMHNGWQQNEKELERGRTKTHNSGAIGRGARGQGVSEADFFR